MSPYNKTYFIANSVWNWLQNWMGSKPLRWVRELSLIYRFYVSNYWYNVVKIINFYKISMLSLSFLQQRQQIDFSLFSFFFFFSFRLLPIDKTWTNAAIAQSTITWAGLEPYSTDNAARQEIQIIRFLKCTLSNLHFTRHTI